MDENIALRGYVVVVMLMVIVSGAAVAPFLAGITSADISHDNKDPVHYNPDLSGTTLSVSQTAQGHWVQVIDYDWSILKAITPGEVTIDKTKTAISTCNLTILRTSQVVQDYFFVDGVINITNNGDVPTEGLSINDIVSKKYASGQVLSSLDVPIDVSGNPILDPNEVGTYSYRIYFTPEEGCLYRNEVQVRIKNHCGYNGTPFGPSLEVGFTIPVKSLIEYQDKEVDIKDVITAPGNGFIVQGDLTHYWHVTAPGFIEYAILVNNEDAVSGGVVPMANLTTLTEHDSKEVIHASVEMELIGGER